MIDLNTFGADMIIRERLDEELRLSATRSLLRRSMGRRPGAADVAAAWLGDRLIRAGQWLKRRHEPEPPSTVSPWRVAGKGA